MHQKKRTTQNLSYSNKFKRPVGEQSLQALVTLASKNLTIIQEQDTSDIHDFYQITKVLALLFPKKGFYSLEKTALNFKYILN